MTRPKESVRLKVSPGVARIVARDAPREVRLGAARGELPLPPGDQLVALFFLFHGGDPEIRSLAAVTLKRMPAETLAGTMTDPSLHPRLLDLLVRLRLDELEVVRAALSHPALDPATVLYVAARGSGTAVPLLVDLGEKLREIPGLLDALLSNPQAPAAVVKRIEKWTTPPAPAGSRGGDEPQEDAKEELNLSKYQLSLNMGVSEKIKQAMTGDKEWRNILIRESNKLVSTAVLKNPRITEGEVLTVVKNRSTCDELIRIVTLNREWLKNYEIKKALVMHPRTPLPKALRYMSILTEKDVKMLAKSRNVAQVIVNNARRMLVAKGKKGA